jgi:hypothetical protein
MFSVRSKAERASIHEVSHTLLQPAGTIEKCLRVEDGNIVEMLRQRMAENLHVKASDNRRTRQERSTVLTLT